MGKDHPWAGPEQDPDELGKPAKAERYEKGVRKDQVAAIAEKGVQEEEDKDQVGNEAPRFDNRPPGKKEKPAGQH